jgi:hypothetical protein
MNYQDVFDDIAETKGGTTNMTPSTIQQLNLDDVIKVLDVSGSYGPAYKDVFAGLVSRNISVTIAGGFVRDVVRGERPQDIDLWCYDKEAGHNVCYSLLRAGFIECSSPHEKLIRRFISPTGVVPDPQIQVIALTGINNQEQLIQNFDFRANAAAVTLRGLDQPVGCCVDGFYLDCGEKRMVMNNIHKMNLKRVVMFAERGWKIDPGVIAIIGEQVKNGRDSNDAIFGGKFNGYEKGV